jgi:protein-tyrosine phosphatase
MRRIEGYALWLGHAGDLANPQSIIASGILVIVDLALNEAPATLPRDFAYCRFPLTDGTGNPCWLIQVAIQTVACLARAGTPTLVCCGAGLSRSPCIAGAAVAFVRGCALEEGLKLVLQSGPADVSPGLWSEICAACTPSAI